MTQQQKLKEVVEATGGCWHSIKGYGAGKYCESCGAGWQELANNPNPSPSDLNALFALAGDITYIKFGGYIDAPNCQLWAARFRYINSTGKTKAEALLNALHEAVKK